LGRWWPARTLTARRSGSIPSASRRKTYPRSGIATNARNKKKRPEIQPQEGTLSTKKTLHDHYLITYKLLSKIFLFK